MSYYIRDGVDLKEVPLHKVETLMNAGITIISDKDIIKELKQQLEVFKSPHNINISSSEYAELLALNAELADVTRKNHEFVLYVSELQQQLEDLKYELNNSKTFHCPNFLTNDSGYVSCQVKEYGYNSYESLLKEAVEVIEKVANYTGTTDLSNVISRQFLAKYRARK